MSSIAELELVCEPHYVQARIHGRNVDVEGLREPEVCSSEFVDIDLQHVAKIDEHMRGSLGPTSDVDASCNNVGRLPTPRQMSGQCQLKEVERHVDTVTPQAQLVC